MPNKFLKYLFIFYFIIFLVTPSLVQAQNRPDAGSILKNLENNKITIPKQNLPEFEEKQKEIIIPKVQPVETFIIKKITFEGNTLVSNDELNFIFKDLINRKIALDELKSAIDEIAILYDKKGYLGFGSLPSQEIEQENLKILIIEGLFGGVKFDEKNLNDLNVDPAIIKKIIENINPIGKPLNVKKLDESILISGDLSGILVNQSLRPGEKSGETDTYVRIVNQPRYFIVASVDNYGSNTTGFDRKILNGSFLSPAKIGDRVDGNYLASDGTDYGSLSYNIPISELGTKLGINGSLMTYKVTGGESKSLNLSGDSQSFGLNFSHPFYRSRTYNLSGIVSLEEKKIINEQASVIQSKYNISTLVLGSNFDLVTNYLLGGQLFISGNYNLANNNYDDSPETFRQNKIYERTNGYNNKLSTTINYNQFITENLIGIIKFTGQLSDQNLDSSQKIYLGGAESIRAYPSSEGSGSNGYVINADIKASVIEGIKLKVFYDYGTVQQYVQNVNTNTRASISGATPNIYSLQGYGLGLENNFYGAEFNLFAAKRINNNPLRNVNGTDSNGAPSRTNLWGKLSYNF